MKPIHLTIKTLIADNVPVPSPDLIADLVEAVLKAPGLRVVSVEVAQVSVVATVTRRVRNVDPLGTKPQASAGATAKPGRETFFCPTCHTRLSLPWPSGEPCPKCGEIINAPL